MLLTGRLGNPERRPLTVAQFRTLSQRVSQMDKPLETPQLQESDIISLGYDRITAQRILSLLGDDALLDRYLQKAKKLDCVPVSRVSEMYPPAVRVRLGLDAPGCLWAKGDLSILLDQTVSLVGSRALLAPNRAFAEAVGREVARQGYTLVSGNAMGADRTAQDACLASGGKVISVVADSLANYKRQENVLYLSEDSFDEPFSAQRALSRNRIIHALGYITIVAQCNAGRGGTWDGSVHNLRNGISPVYCFRDGSSAAEELARLGATLIDSAQLARLDKLKPDIQTLI